MGLAQDGVTMIFKGEAVYPLEWKNSPSSKRICQRACSHDADAADIRRALMVIHRNGCREGEDWLDKIEAVHDLDLISLEHPEIVHILLLVREVRSLVPDEQIRPWPQMPIRL